jgi:hypothetical protein
MLICKFGVTTPIWLMVSNKVIISTSAPIYDKYWVGGSKHHHDEQITKLWNCLVDL